MAKLRENNKDQFRSDLHFAFANDSTIRYHVGISEAKRRDTGQLISPILVN